MIDFTCSHEPLSSITAQAYVVVCNDGAELPRDVAEECYKIYPHYQAVLERRKFKGKAGQSCAMTGEAHGESVAMIFVGMGSLSQQPEDIMEGYRRAVSKAIREAECQKVESIVLALPTPAALGTDAWNLGKETLCTMYMTAYHFDTFITDESRRHADRYDLTLVAHQHDHDALAKGAEVGQRIGHAVNQARDWCDLPPACLTPSALAEQAEKIAAPHDHLTCKVFDKKDILEMGMGGLIAVSQGSDQEPRFVIMEYSCGDKNAPHVSLVGKGVTFDSGGLSIKPAHAMDEMKDDMAGAASVIATMQAVAYLKPKVNIAALVPMTENLLGGSAMKPGDIIRHYNGITSEVKNTDAEGRLILADALAYASEKYSSAAILDAATLTGACQAALGKFYAGMVSKYDDLSDKVQQAGKRSGDQVWKLPFHEDYRIAVRSTVADVCNIGERRYHAGATTAGFFLSHFVPEDTPWVHLDIAGVSFNVPNRPYYRPGATGFGVRLFVDLLMNW